MTLRLTPTLYDSMLGEIQSALAAGGTLELYDGARPAAVTDAPAGTLLASITLNVPATGAPTGGQLPLDNTPALSAEAEANGTASFFRIRNSSSTVLLDGTVGLGGVADLVLDAVNMTIGDTVTVVSGYLVGA